MPDCLTANTAVSHFLEHLVSDDSLSKWTTEYLVDCKARHLADGSMEFNRKKIKGFLTFFESQGVYKISQITPDLIRQFLIFLSDNGHNPGGVHGYYRILRAFLYWYENQIDDITWRNPIRKIKAPILPLEPLNPVSVTDIKALCNTCDPHNFFGSRDLALFKFLYDSAVRVTELTALNIEDIDLVKSTVQIKRGKGQKPRTIYIGDKCKRDLRRYLRLRTDNDPALWINQEGSRLTNHGIRMMLRRRSQKAKLKKIPMPHDFRRASALERLRSGQADILTISKLMGHSSLQVLQRYVKQSGEDLQVAALRSSPVDHNF